MISDIERGGGGGAAAILPGDEVRLAGELPASLTDDDAAWLRETVFVVRYVGDDATIDVQPDLTEDYVIKAVPIAIMKPAKTQSAA